MLFATFINKGGRRKPNTEPLYVFPEVKNSVHNIFI